LEYLYIDINYVYPLKLWYWRQNMQQSISKRALFVTHKEVEEVVGGFESRPQFIVSKSDTELKPKDKVTVLEERLKEFENMCLAQKNAN